MSQLSALKLTAAKKPTNQPAIVQQRNKLSKRLHEQMQLAQAQRDGNTYTAKQFKSVTDLDGQRKTVEVHKRVKPWWFTSEGGKLCLNVRYGSKVIELARGKTAVEVGALDELLTVLATIKAAVLDGELDAQIQAVSGQLREGFRARA